MHLTNSLCGRRRLKEIHISLIHRALHALNKSHYFRNVLHSPFYRAAANAAQAALAAKEAIETGDAENAAEAAIECQQAATAAIESAQRELIATLERKRKLSKLGVVVETLKGGEPIDVMNHLGERSGYTSVVWRAGCWGHRGVESILAGAFQWVSAHLAVDAVGGKFWQLMLAERAVQAACGQESKVKVFAVDEGTFSSLRDLKVLLDTRGRHPLTTANTPLLSKKKNMRTITPRNNRY